ncbi:hypothetical protein DFJ67_5222 [Asanoa ferruginea]|uniref:Secreted protein n=1 Tax=Asanoa ferruginea TaxID=53367 RepID=A0A3D9ZPL1_9ACTN|nr:hypothetical protein DFJ67_5222 [Asanoa ferruginea]
MRVKRAVLGTAVAIIASFGLSVVSASPAAADAGIWRAFGNTNPISSSASLWRCGATKTITTNVVAQGCAIRAAGGANYAQIAMIVRNNRSSLFGAGVTMWGDTTDSTPFLIICNASGVAANSWSVCFSNTFQSSAAVQMFDGSVNGVYVADSPWV